MPNDKIVAPEQTKAGHAVEIAQSGLSAIPVVGGLVDGVLMLYFRQK